MQVRSLGQEDPLEEGLATHSSILAGRIPWTEEPGGLQSIGSQSQVQLKPLSMHACNHLRVLPKYQGHSEGMAEWRVGMGHVKVPIQMASTHGTLARRQSDGHD